MRQITQMLQWYRRAEEECTVHTKPERDDRILQQKQRKRFGYKLYTVVDDTASFRRIADHQATTHRDWLICAGHFPGTLATLSGLSTSHTTSHHSVP